MKAGFTALVLKVKNVTLRDGHVAKFPDAVTVRGRKHLNSLKKAVERDTMRACFISFRELIVTVLHPRKR
ncbi:MAG: DNA/RNA nuclease SfsA [Candidatus Brocadia sp.]